MKIKELLTTEKEWTKGAGARSSKGKVCPAVSIKAKRWCLIGALIKCYPGYKLERVQAEIKLANTIAMHYKYNDSGDSRIVDFNDAERTTFKDIQFVLGQADV